jgi:uncharacterized protein (DUF1778 family)
MVKKTPTAARIAQNKRVNSIYFKTPEELQLVRRAARKAKMSFTAFLRQAAVNAAKAA